MMEDITLTTDDIIFTPLSDIGANEFDSIEEHKQLLNNEIFDGEALTACLEKVENKSMNASLFNSMQERIYKLGNYVANQTPIQYEVFSEEDLDINLMTDGAVFFNKIIT